ncbi:hypothetical protein NQZ68_002267 [Dissostichus eleginoides]|nr:hypothetical protein NQZ68_002267 [Dissostichus eleginoides]
MAVNTKLYCGQSKTHCLKSLQSAQRNDVSSVALPSGFQVLLPLYFTTVGYREKRVTRRSFASVACFAGEKWSEGLWGGGMRGIEDGGMEENWAVVMDAVQGKLLERISDSIRNTLPLICVSLTFEINSLKENHQVGSGYEALDSGPAPLEAMGRSSPIINPENLPAFSHRRRRQPLLTQRSSSHTDATAGSSEMLLSDEDGSEKEIPPVNHPPKEKPLSFTH